MIEAIGNGAARARPWVGFTPPSVGFLLVAERPPADRPLTAPHPSRLPPPGAPTTNWHTATLDRLRRAEILEAYAAALAGDEPGYLDLDTGLSC